MGGHMRRVLILVPLLVATVAAAQPLVALYARPDPFRAPYQSASEAEQRAITRRLAVTLFVLPLAAAALVTALLGRRNRRTVAVALASASFFIATSGFHAITIWLRLPYAFGSSYEHASPEQLGHLALASRGALSLIALGAILGLAALAVRRGEGASSDGEGSSAVAAHAPRG
jgi:hypothetical protein